MMFGAERTAPLLAPGARVEVSYGAGVLVCRLCEVRSTAVHLAVPGGTRRTEQLREGRPARLTVYSPLPDAETEGVCLECDTFVREWVWRRPPLLVMGPVVQWRSKARRTAPRARRQLSARLCLEDGREYIGRTQDVSTGGVALMVAGLEDVVEGTVARLTLQVDNGMWCDDLPVRVARVRHWLRSAGRSVEIGAQLQLSSELESLRWQECLKWLGVEE